jgi:L-malate glycosyltransferase
MQINLKVLHLSSEKSWRGGEQQIAYLIEELGEMGVTNVAAVKKGSVFEQHCIRKNIPHLSLPFANTVDVLSASTIARFCRKNQIDIVHMHSAKSHGIGVLSALLGNRTPLVLSRRVDFIPKDNFLTRWRYNHPSVRAILCVSDKITEIMKTYVENPQRCTTVHSGIDLARFASMPPENTLRKEFHIPPAVKLIGNTSALEHHKDYPTFIRTVRTLVDENASLMAFIVGKGSLETSLKDQVRNCGLEQAVTFTGFRTDIQAVLGSLDVFLMTSETEGLGTSVLDAFACGVPVVATAAGGIPEMVIHGYSGLLAPVGDSDKLAELVRAVLDDEKLRTKLITGGKERLLNFTKRSTAEKTVAVYRQLSSR